MTIETKAGNIFYIVVDKQKQNDNVYLLSETTETELTALAKEASDESVEHGIPDPQPEPAPECVCNSKCEKGEVNEKCAVCAADLTACTGKAAPPPETTTEQEAPAVEPPQEITGIGILTIERINLKMPVTEGATAAQLDVAAGWIPETAPIGGTGNAVIAGHRSYTNGRQFNRLAELQPGDPAALEPPEDRRLLTLYTCTPIRTATHRLLIRAERVVL